jgi:hypothetical protein
MSLNGLLKDLTKVNMLNLIIASILIVWVFATVKSIILKEDMTQSAQNTVDGLQNIMLMVLGYYLKNNSLGQKDSEVSNN